MATQETYNTTYAQFTDHARARACARELRRGQIARPRVRMVVSSTRKGHAELPLSLTHTWGGMLRGILLGAAAGFVGALVLGLIEGSRDGSFNWALVALFAVLAALMGSVTGGLVGSMNPLPQIDRLEEYGDVLVAVQSSDRRDVEWARRVLERWGAQPEFRNTPPHLAQDWWDGGRPTTHPS